MLLVMIVFISDVQSIHLQLQVVEDEAHILHLLLFLQQPLTEHGCVRKVSYIFNASQLLCQPLLCLLRGVPCLRPVRLYLHLVIKYVESIR